MDQVKVVVNVIERDFSRVKLNQKARISVGAYPDETFAGKIALISPTIDRITRTASVEIVISNRNHRLKPGMFAEVDIIVREKADAILIPTYAVLEQSDVNRVFILADGKATSQVVQLGADQGESVEVLSGVAIGDSLIVAGHHRISSGETVRVIQGGGD
jgi:RND family efflux transporter MFP subunit